MRMEFDNLAPVLLFVYKRPEHTRRTLQALAKNSLANKSILYIYADGPRDEADTISLRKIAEVRRIIKKEQWCKEVHIVEASKNKGLANSIIDGVTEKVNEHGKVIILEDDLITSCGFLEYMNNALNKYSDNTQVMHVSGYQFPIEIPAKGASFFLPFANSWGWATWKRAWNHFDPLATGYEKLKTDRKLERSFNLNGAFPYSTMLINQMEKNNINSWAIRWLWAVFKNDGLSLFPDNSLIKNIGYGKDATHTVHPDPYTNLNFDEFYCISEMPVRIEINEEMFLLVTQLLLQAESLNKTFSGKIKNVIKRSLIRLGFYH